MPDPSEPLEPYRRKASTDVDRALVVDALSEIHKLVDLIDARREELLPGEIQDSFHAAWVESSRAFYAMAAAADGNTDVPEGVRTDVGINLIGHELIGAPGKYKRDIWTMIRNGFLGLFSTTPPPEQLRLAREEGARAVDIGSVIVTSVTDSEVGRAAGEFLSMTKHALEVAARR
jgi:hypothetical protein